MPPSKWETLAFTDSNSTAKNGSRRRSVLCSGSKEWNPNNSSRHLISSLPAQLQKNTFIVQIFKFLQINLHRVTQARMGIKFSLQKKARKNRAEKKYIVEEG